MSSNKSTTRSNNFLSNLVTIVFIFGICIAFGQEFIPTISNTRQFKAVNVQARLNSQTAMDLQRQVQRLEQQQERHENRTERSKQAWSAFKVVLVLALWCVFFAFVIWLAFKLVKYARYVIATSQSFEFIRQEHMHKLNLQHEISLEKLRVKQLQADQPKAMFEGLRVAGNLTYNPSNRFADSHNLIQHSKAPKILDGGNAGSGTDWLEPLAPITQLPTPSFKKALEDTRAHGALVLGYDETAQPILGDADKTFSISFGGKSGSGKSGACLFSIASFLAINPDTKIAILDPHKGNSQSLETNLSALSASYFCAPASDDTSEVLAFCNVLIQEFKSRKAIGDCDQLPYILVVVEELLALLNGWNSDEIKESVLELCQCLGYQSRKYKMVGIGIAQVWDAANAKGLKKVFTSSYTCRTTQDDFRNQTGTLAAQSKQLPIPVDQLATGQAYLKTTTGDLMLLNIPHVHADDLQMFAQSLHRSHSNITVDSIPTVTIDSSINSEETATEQQPTNSNGATSVTHLSAQEQLYVKAFIDEGKDASIQAREATGSTTSKAYKSLRADVNEAIKKAMGQRSLLNNS